MAAEDQAREFELVLGNKQLFIVLLIVVVLLGLFFAMGYVMGRSSGPVETAAARPAEQRAADAPARRSAIDPPRETAPATPAASDAKSYPLPTPGGQPAPSQTAPQAAPAPAQPKPLEIPAASVYDPPQGTLWLQVSAVAKPEAELLVEVLNKKGFKSVVAPGPTDKVFRVLVGPLRDVAEVGKVKGDLEQAGFKSMVRKY